MTRHLFARPRSLLLLLLLFAGSTPAVAQLTPDTPVPVDPNLTVGRLANGLTYYIRENSQPENRAQLWLVVNAGSVLEDDDQLGLAHLVEHMAFNGTEHFEKQELIDYLESIGMQFGPSINAFTSFDETVYQLFVPTDDPGIVATAFQILEDWAHGVSFDPEEIDKERGVVIEEWRLGLGAGARLRDKQFPTLFQGSRYADRLPIGDPEILRTFEHESLTRYYRDWYRPELMAVVAVGDFETAAIESLVQRHFSGLESPDAPKPRTYYDVPGHSEPLFTIATDPETPNTLVQLMHKREVPGEGTLLDYRRGLITSLIDGMFNQRLFELTQKPDAPFLVGFSGQGRFVRTSEIYQLAAAVRDGEVETGLEALLTEAERVIRFGFTSSELDRQKTEMLRGFEQAHAERENRDSRSHAAELQRVYLQNEPVPGIEWEFEMAGALLATVSLEEVNAMARVNLSPDGRVVMVSAPEKPDVPVPTDAQLLSVIAGVSDLEIEAYEDEVADAPLMENEPAPGTIVARDRIEEVGVTVLELSNGSRVLLKPTDYKDDEIIFRSYSPGGSSLASDEIYESASTAAQLVGQGGLGQLSMVDLQKKLAGKAAGVSPNIGTLREGLSGGASPKDVETLFQLIHLNFTAPRKDPVVFSAFKQQAAGILANRGASPQTHFGDTLTAVVSRNHARRQPQDLDWLEALDLDVAFDFYRDRFGDAGDFTFIFVGTFDVAEMEPLIEKYLASLPATGREESWADEGVRAPAGVIEKFVRKGLEPQSQTRIIFTGDFEYTAENRTAMRALAQSLELRLRERMREDLGGTYSVSANGSYSQFPVATYSFSIAFGSDPGRLQELVGVVFEEIERMRVDGPSEEDLIKVREQDRRAMETNRESNGWWAGQLLASDFEGLDPTRLLDDELLDGVTVDAVRGAARQWLLQDRYIRVSLVPENYPIMD